MCGKHYVEKADDKPGNIIQSVTKILGTLVEKELILK